MDKRNRVYSVSNNYFFKPIFSKFNSINEKVLIILTVFDVATFLYNFELDLLIIPKEIVYS